MNIKGERRYGYLTIPIRELERNDPNFRLKMRAIMTKIIVVRAEYLLYNDMLEYTAWSEYFDIVPLGEYPPKYDIIWCEDAVTFSKQE